MNFNLAFDFLKVGSRRHCGINSQEDWARFRASSLNPEWVYLIRFDDRRFAWGTCSGSSDRLRRASIFNPKLTGKYDRRVDYLMLKQCGGIRSVQVFEAPGGVGGSAVDLETSLKRMAGQNHCFGGFKGRDRVQVSIEILTMFKSTPHYQSLSEEDQRGFDRYLCEVFFARAQHPSNPKRTFHWGDSLEPGFLRTIGKAELEGPIERALGVRF